MWRKMGAWVAALTLAAALVGGCTDGGKESDQAQADPAAVEVAALRSPMTEALAALGDLKTQVEKGDGRGRQEAYNRFAAAFGQVLAPVSFKDAAAAQRMANANTAMQELLAQKEPNRAALMQQADVLMQEVTRTAGQMGLSLMGTASAEVGAESARVSEPARAGGGVAQVDTASARVGPDLAQRRPRVIEVTAREYRFTPARIEVKKGERVTVRLRNAGTEKHEWELEAFGVEIRPIDPGKTGEVTFTADKAGIFEYACHMDGHYEKGMKGFFIVK